MDLRVNSRLTIPAKEIELRTGPSSGPGGQHANRSQTKVEAVFRINESTKLSEGQKRRLTDRFGPVVAAVSQDERSQLRNREVALERLVTKLRGGLRVPKARRATKPTRAARERRISSKKQRGELKAQRRRPPRED